MGKASHCPLVMPRNSPPYRSAAPSKGPYIAVVQARMGENMPKNARHCNAHANYLVWKKGHSRHMQPMPRRTLQAVCSRTAVVI